MSTSVRIAGRCRHRPIQENEYTIMRFRQQLFLSCVWVFPTKGRAEFDKKMSGVLKNKIST